MKKPITIAQMPTNIIIAEILTYEKDEKDLTFEEIVNRGNELDNMPREQLNGLYIEMLLLE